MKKLAAKPGLLRVILILTFALGLGSRLTAAAEGLSAAADEQVVTVSTAWSMDRARPGDTLTLAVVADIKKGFHINADAHQIKASEDFKPYATRLTVAAADDGITIGAARYPKAAGVKVAYAAGDLMSFEGRTVFYLPIKLEKTLPPGMYKLKLELAYQACADNYCLFPAKVSIPASIEVAAVGSTVNKINAPLFSGYLQQPAAAGPARVNFGMFGWGFSIDATSGWGVILLLMTAAFGGLLLNLTPCVLPLIPIKIISLSHAAGNRKKCFILGLAMSAGVLVFWMLLGILIALVSGFTATSQLFHYPAFTLAVGVIIAVMAFGMFGLFSMRLPAFIYLINPEQDTRRGSFVLGVLAAVLSTPCTAPFMGAAAAWAATQRPVTTLATFSAIGIGMALPYLILAARPTLVEKMPKTGPASELVKQVMGLFMLAAAAYFIGVGLATLFASPPAAPSKLYWWPVMGFCIAAGGWLALRALQIAPSKKPGAFFAGIGILMVALSAWGTVQLTKQGPIDWVAYTPQRFKTEISRQRVIVMVFTAEWCLNCKALEQGVLNTPKIADLLHRRGITAMKVDITGHNPAGKAKLNELGYLTIPLLVVFAPDGKPMLKSDFYTAEQVYGAVMQALKSADSSS
jgi:thiol:disulfide interchange protein DsbD